MMELRDNRVKNNLLYYCKLRGISIGQLANTCGISSSNLYSAISGKINLNLTLKNAAKLAEVLNITIDELYYGNNIIN